MASIYKPFSGLSSSKTALQITYSQIEDQTAPHQHISIIIMIPFRAI